MEVTLPHRFAPRAYQLPFLSAWDSGKKRFVIVWHRRSGKDKTAFATLPKKMFERVGAYFYFAPTYTQGKKIIWDGMDRDGFKFTDHVPREIVKSRNETEMKIELINGSYLQVIGTDKIDSIVGTNPVGCIFTEYSLQDPRAWDLIRPILAENGGWAVFIFTPRGMNHGWKVLQQAQANPDTWFWQILTVDDTGVISPDVVEQERREMPHELFEQEYYCKFIEGAGSFFKRVDDNVLDAPIELTHKFQLGVDLAKYQDWTVITPFDLETFNVLPQIRFSQVDWNLQKARIEAEARKYKAKVLIDSTGVGDPITEDLTRAGLDIEPFKFTETSRRQLLDHLSLLLAQDRIKIPNDTGLTGELKSMRFSLTEQGKIKVQVPEGLTDDRIMSLGLAVWNQFTPQKPIINDIQEDYGATYGSIGI